jgi:hypothetical protein
VFHSAGNIVNGLAATSCISCLSNGVNHWIIFNSASSPSYISSSLERSVQSLKRYLRDH